MDIGEKNTYNMKISASILQKIQFYEDSLVELMQYKGNKNFQIWCYQYILIYLNMMIHPLYQQNPHLILFSILNKSNNLVHLRLTLGIKVNL